jgi:hypothetical protein
MPDVIVQISPYLTCETLLDGQLNIYTVTSGDRETIDLWAQEVVARTRSYGPSYVPLVLHDFSYPKLAFSVYMRSTAQRITDEIGARPVKIAIAFPGTSLMRGLILPILQIFQRRTMTKYPERTMKLFDSREAALQWLKSFT